MAGPGTPGLARGQKLALTDKRLKANAANARRPRGSWAGTEERAKLDQAKALLRECMPAAARRLAEIIGDPDTSDELFLQAFKLAADRCGLGASTEVSIGEGMQPLVVIVGSEAEQQ